jgi:glycosyltransferase involved in cell wall biosynthesis
LKYDLPSEYILYVGTIEERKNLLTVVKALEQVKEIPLVVVGKRRKYLVEVMKYAVQHKLEKRIKLVHDAEHSEMPAIYRGAQLFAFPSIFEGFGIPIIEALVTQVPVISSRGSCFPETAGPDSVFFDPMNVKELAEKINGLLRSPAMMDNMRVKGAEYARKFHPSVITTQLEKIYEAR